MKIIVAPDKFKGSLTSFELCEIVSKALRKKNRNIEVLKFPVADGGDGFALVMKHYLHTTTVSCNTIDPLGREIKGSYEWDDNQSTAIIEMAVASGLALLNKEEQNPMLTSTMGTGILVKNAMEKGATNIILGLGGSATNDGGMGVLAALGFQFIDEDENLLPATGKSLGAVRKIIQPETLPALKLQVAADVKNILYGPQGAAFIFAPQKGANKEQVKMLDKGLRNFAAVLEKSSGREISMIAGTGAAGGIAAGLMAFFDVEIKSGIEIIVNASGLKEKLAGSDMLITGEGKIDQQTREGKVIGHLTLLAKEYNLPVKAVCGVVDLDSRELEKLGLTQVLAIQDGTLPEEHAIKRAGELLIQRIESSDDFV